MHKGLVLKVTNQYALVLSQDNGYYKLIAKKGMVAGRKIFFFEEDILRHTSPKSLPGQTGWNIRQKAVSLSVIAACLVLFFLFGNMLGLSSGTNALYAVVSVDINPSVELQLNQDKYVIGIQALNTEGYEIAGQYLVGLKIEEAVSLIVRKAAEKHYLNDHDTILLAASLQAANEESRTIFTRELTDNLSSAQLPEEYSYLLLASEAESYGQAKANKLSLGKYEMMTILNSQPASGKVDPQKIKEMKVKEILADEKVLSGLQEKNPKSHVWIKEKTEADNLKDKKIKDKKEKVNNGEKRDNGEKKDRGDKKDSKEEKGSLSNKDGNNSNKDKDKDSIPANAGDRGKSDSRNDKKGPIKSPDPPRLPNHTPDVNKPGNSVFDNKGNSGNSGNKNNSKKAEKGSGNPGKSADKGNNNGNLAGNGNNKAKE